ncbi:hypothetical protein AURDEDRAFT_109872 [Auricularia subglabra TFB-10046 SS5]|nr:hypothetical protein AURDEDRAFT_109872 [Auricularia subglabra TFB-10046 SS5]
MSDGPSATNEAPAPSTSWWPPRAATPRPWSDLPRRQPTVPPEQSEALAKTKAAVLRATLKLVADVAHEGLAVAADALEFVPVPGVAKLAGVLLLIWDTVQGVESNRLACLRLTEVAATMLWHVRNDIDAAGQDVLAVLDEPLRALHQAFKRTHQIVQKQAQRPFLKRYLKRDEDERKIEHCGVALQAAMNSYSLSVQTRTLQHILKVESTLSSSLGLLSPNSSSSCVTLTPTPPTPRAAGPAHLSSPFAVDPARAQVDAALDRADMEARIREALSQGTDAALIALLQVPVHELPEAQWAMRRALEGMSSRPTDKEDQNFFHVEFMESSIDAMARLSDYRSVPMYTVTKYELDRDVRIGWGTYAEVYKGTWRNSTVAIKILLPVTPQDAFKREIEIWRMLKHTHILPLWGASSPDSGIPFFFVSPYLKNGALPAYLHRVYPPAPERMRMMHEIVLGMVYLHSRSVVHGDLKAANVLVDDQFRCVIADFGQSDVKSEVLRLTGKAPPHGTLRWLPPELMDGEGMRTVEADVYAFAICCVEVMTCGQVPWVMINDDNVRNLVINYDKRPMLPETDDARLLERHIALWWARDPRRRPAFASISVEFNKLRGLPSSSQIVDFFDLPKTPRAYCQTPAIMSPPLQPVPVPPLPQGIPVPSSSKQQHASNALEGVPQSGSASSDSFYSVLSHPRQSDVESADGHSMRTSFSASTETQETEPDDWSGPVSPPPQDVGARFRRDERRYRLRLLHNYHPSLRLPLWVPTKVQIGAVGYIDKDRGTFVTLFNAYNPWQHAHNGSGRPLPSLRDYGRVPKIATQTRDDRERPAGRPRAWSFLSGMTFLNSQIPHGPKFNLHAGRKEAFLFTELSVYRYMQEVDTAREWFTANIGAIMEAYGAAHKVQREDMCLIIGALDASDWAMFVSHNSPGAVVHLQIKPEAERKPGQPWAAFVEEVPDKKSPPTGPSLPDDHTVPVSTGRVSLKDPVPRDAEHWDTMLLARLRFRVDQAAPTSL